MNIQRKLLGISLPPGRLVLSLLGAGLLFSIILRDAARHREPSASVLMVTQASAREISSPLASPASRVVPPPVRVQVEAAQTCAMDPSLLQSLRAELMNPAGTPRSLAESTSSSSSEAASEPDWNIWGRLASARAPVTLLDTPPTEGLETYAVHSHEGATLLLINRSQSKAPLRLNIRLAHGIYKLERLTFTPREDTTGFRSSPLFSSLPPAIAAHTEARLERLQGRDLTTAGGAAFPYTMEAGQICLLRFTDTAYTGRAALNEVREQLRILPKSSSELARRLHVILDGTGRYEKALAISTHMSPDSRRTLIHHFLLVLGQAHSLHRNFQITEGSDPERGATFMGALERLNEALADTSATLIGLVPQIELTPEEAPAARAQSDSHLIPVSQTELTTHSALMTIALANTGNHAAALVKIGVELASLPPSVHCEPQEPALLGTLAPGQTVRAAYHLHWNGTPEMPGYRCVGDISYFTDGAPAHLRARSW